MTFAALVDRVRADFLERPALEVSIGQGVRQWGVGFDDCRYLIDALVDAGFLAWTPRRTVVRTGRDLDLGAPHRSDVPVLRQKNSNRSVGPR